MKSSLTRRRFLLSSGTAFGACLCKGTLSHAKPADFKPLGPASRYVPSIKAAFVRREEEYGMRWPGQIYDGVAALEKYRRDFSQAAGDLGIRFDLRQQPIYSLQEAEKWVAQASGAAPDGLMVILLDRQEHSWPTAGLAVGSCIPTLVYSPVGTSFTTNTAPLTKKRNLFISCTNDIREPILGMRMVRAGAKLRETRFIVLKGKEWRETEVPDIGTKLHWTKPLTR